MLRAFVRTSLFLLAVAPAITAQNTAIPGKYYEYYNVAGTQGGTFTAVGLPAINDNGLVAFTGTTAAGQTIWVSDGHLIPPRNINPGQANLGRNFFDPQLQINTNNQVIAKDYIQGSSQNIRIWNANLTDSFTYLARAGTGQAWTALNGAPSVNSHGDGVFGGITGTTHDLIQVTNGVTSTFAFNTSAPQPAIDTAGDMVGTSTNRSTGLNQITLFRPGFASQVSIATGSDFSYLDTTPGISDDGNVIAFQGTLTAAGATHLGLTAGAGIFAAINTGSTWQIIRVTGLMVEVIGSGGNGDGVCDPGETCKNAAELGFDDNSNPVNFASYPTNSRIAVTNVDFGAAGIANDTFVISFIATPSHAGRTNPVTKNAPLLFSANTGLWTIRVDVKNQLVAPKGLVFHPFTAIPVVQVGDQIGSGNTVSALAVNMQIANAAEDEFGAVRTMRRGDHRIAFQATVNGSAQMIFRANHLDSSQDGLLDHWKTSGIDMDQDGVADINLAAMGAFVGQRDLFLQMDWLSNQPGYTFSPAPGVVTAVGGGAGDLPGMLATAPALQGNMYGVRRDGATPAVIPAGVTMHIDGGPGADVYQGSFSFGMGAGPLDGGKSIGMPNNNSALVEVLYFGVPGSITLPGVNTRPFQDVKDNFFGSRDKDARELAFKYSVLASHFEFIDTPAANHPITGAGTNYVIVGDAFPAGGVRSGNFIKITAGPGAGQTVQITSFTGQQMFVNNFPGTIPTASSTFAYLSGSTGNSEVFFYPDPDNNSLPGNDFILSLGDQPVNPDGNLANECVQWRTLAHEMGHTLGFAHGGVDQNAYNTNYHSLMSYSYQLACTPPSSVVGYSGVGDLVFDNFSNFNHQFAQTLLHVGNSLGIGYGALNEQAQQVPEQNVQDYINQNGPYDIVKPVVAITSPAANSQVSTSGPLTTTIQATDNKAIAKVKATFDANGDGVVGPTENVTAQPAGGNLYTATFSSITGTLTPRTLTAIATDTSGNTATTSISLNVGNGTQFALTVTRAGTGTGSVSSSPTGITCPSTCSASYNSGTTVTLTAAPASGSTFAGWSGACSGTSTCSVTMTQARAVTATFNLTAAPDFTLSAPASKTIGQGDFATYLITETVQNGFSGAITLSVTGLPAGTSSGFTTNPFTGSSAMYIVTHATTTLGTYPMTITGTSGALTHSIAVSLVITTHGPVDFALSATPATQTVTHGNSATYTVTETPAGGFAGSVTLTAINVPAGATATFATNPFTGSTTMTIATTASTPLATYQIAIGGYSGSLLHTTPVNLKVQ